jgi:hypothetical protein
MYAWVEFTPIYAPASPAAAPVSGQPVPASAAAALAGPQPAVVTTQGGVRRGVVNGRAPAGSNVRGGTPANGENVGQVIKSYAAQFKLESEKAGARAMFQKQAAAGQPVSGGRTGTPVVGNPGRVTQPGNQRGNQSGNRGPSAIDLFNEARRLIDR